VHILLGTLQTGGEIVELYIDPSVDIDDLIFDEDDGHPSNR
jgi:hypothetical protein